MRSWRRLVQVIELTKTADPAYGGHALGMADKTAIDGLIAHAQHCVAKTQLSRRSAIALANLHEFLKWVLPFGHAASLTGFLKSMLSGTFGNCLVPGPILTTSFGQGCRSLLAPAADRGLDGLRVLFMMR